MKKVVLFLLAAGALFGCASVEHHRYTPRSNDFRERFFVSAPIKQGGSFTIVSRTSNDIFATELAIALGQSGYVIKRNLLSTLPDYVGRQVLARDAWQFRDEFARKLLKDQFLIRRTVTGTNIVKVLDRYKDDGNLSYDIDRMKKYVKFVQAYQTLQQKLGCDYIVYIWSSPTGYHIEITAVATATVTAVFRIDATETAWRKFIPRLTSGQTNSTLLVSRYSAERRDASIRAIEYARRVVQRLGGAK